MYLSNKPNLRKLKAFIRVDAYGNIIPASIVFRKEMPKGMGPWKELQLSYCCDPNADSIITILNNSSNVITDISFSGMTWSGTLSSNDRISFIIPRGYGKTITIVHDNTVDLDYVGATVQGSGTIDDGSGFDNTGTFSVTTTSDPGSQYFLTITDN